MISSLVVGQVAQSQIAIQSVNFPAKCDVTVTLNFE